MNQLIHPKEIGDLSSLAELYLFDQLTAIPKEIGKLSNLEI